MPCCLAHHHTAWAVGIAEENGESAGSINTWWTSDHFQSFAVAFSSPKGVESDNEWWASAEFKEFMRVWSIESAREQGREPADFDEWFQSAEFKAFMQGYESAVDQAVASGEFENGRSTSGTTYTQVPTDIED